MDDLVEVLIEVVGEILEGLLEGIIDFAPKHFNATHLIETNNRESYVTGLIATALLLCYSDDKTFDRHERKMVKQIIQSHKKEMTKKMKKNITYIFKSKKKIGLENLKVLFTKLNVDNDTVINITYDLEKMLREINKDTTKLQDTLLNIRKEYKPEFYG